MKEALSKGVLDDLMKTTQKQPTDLKEETISNLKNKLEEERAIALVKVGQMIALGVCVKSLELALSSAKFNVVNDFMIGEEYHQTTCEVSSSSSSGLP